MSFLPQFCPNPNCPHHLRRNSPQSGEPPWFRFKSGYRTLRNGVVPRYQCTHCGRTFSRQTFSLDYRLRHSVSCAQVLASLFTCQGQRQLARVLGSDANAVARRLSRLGAQALATHARLLDQLPEADLEIVFDGLESFVHSHHHPLHVNLLVGKKAELVYGFNLVFLQHKGRMTAVQRAKRDAIESTIVRKKGHGIEQAAAMFADYADWAASKGRHTLVLYTDKHRDYPAALKKAGLEDRVSHVQISSRQKRTVTNPLFAVNYLDRQFRKDKSEFVRETTRWAQRPDRMMERVAVYVAWHNIHKPHRIKDRRSETHAQKMGLSGEWCEREWKRLQTERFFPKREPLRAFHCRIWYREGVLETVPRKDVFVPPVALGRLRA